MCIRDRPKEARSKVIDGILASRTDCKDGKPVYEKYRKIFFKKTKEKFKQEHPEVARYEKAAAYLAKHPDDKDSTQKELQEEQEKLVGEIAGLKEPLTEVQEDLKKLRVIGRRKRCVIIRPVINWILLSAGEVRGCAISVS